MKYKKVALIVGGMGSERDVSLSTGKAFEGALKNLNLNYQVIDAGADFPELMSKSDCDVALLALHGKYAEDGIVQGILEYLKIPYSGSGVLTSALCMDKVLTKQTFQQNGIKTAEYQVLNLKGHQAADMSAVYLKPPVVVKPSREGSSVGVSICHKAEDILPAIEFARKYDYQVIVERFINGPEVTVPIVNGKALTPIEIVPKTDFYDYKNKYTAGNTDYFLPARVEKKVLSELKATTEKIFETFNIGTYARVDYMIDEQSPSAIEINTLPGCTPTSLLPKSAEFDGISFDELILKLIEGAHLDYEGLR